MSYAYSEINIIPVEDVYWERVALEDYIWSLHGKIRKTKAINMLKEMKLSLFDAVEALGSLLVREKELFGV